LNKNVLICSKSI